MPETFPSGASSTSDLLPITIPQTSDTANIQDAFTNFYYGNLDLGASPDGTDLYNTTFSVGGYIKKLFTDKVDSTGATITNATLINPSFSSAITEDVVGNVTVNSSGASVGKIFVQSTEPTGAVAGDIWMW